MTDQAAGTRGWVVLIVDDEPDIRHILVRALGTAGYAVLQAAHGAAALEQVRTSMPHLAITDRMMPVMDGDELIEQLRTDHTTTGIPIVMLTGTPGHQSAADAVVMKPFDHHELVDLVDRLIGRTR